MADIRELMILDPGPAGPSGERGVLRPITGLRMRLRRLVVRASRYTPVRAFFVAVYQLHIRVVKLLGKRYEGTRAVYLTSGMASGDFNVGISDIDIAMYGNWTDQRQFRLMKIFGVLTLPFPLFDRRSLASISSVEDLQELCRTDMFMALNHAVGARQWKLLYGEHVLAELPGISVDRFAGCVFMDVRRWWSTLARSAFGADITARDTIFQNSICFKSVAGMLKAEQMLDGNFLEVNRRSLLEQEQQQTPDATLQALLESARQHFLDPRPNIVQDTVQWFLAHAESFQERLAGKPFLAPICPFRHDGAADERILRPETMTCAQQLTGTAREKWSGLRASYLVPAVVLPSVDTLALVLEVEGGPPPAGPIQQLCHQRINASGLSQRLVVFLLLRNAAYQLDIAGTLDFFHYVLTPQTAPDLFLTLQDPAFLLYGEPRRQPDTPGWSAMCQEIFDEELTARRGAYARFGPVSRPSAIDNVRNLWRFLQLVAIEHSIEAGEAILPSTATAVRRATVSRFPELDTDLQELELLLATSSPADATDEELLSRIYQRLANP